MKTISTHGMVRQSAFAQPISTSSPMLGLPYPMEMTPLQMGYLPAAFTGTRNPATSDQILNWTRDFALPGDKDGYTAYWLNKFGATNKWAHLPDVTSADQNNTPFIRAGRSYWYMAKSARLAHVVPVPWTLPSRTDNNVAP